MLKDHAMKTLCFFFIAGMLFILPSCKRTIDVTCTSSSLAIHGIAYISDDIAGGKIYTYTQNNTFANLIDSAQLSNYSVSKSGDTTVFGILNTGYDYKIIMPAMGNTYYISNMILRGVTHQTFTYTAPPGVEHASFYCFNPLASCYVNGVIHNFTNTDTQAMSDTLYLHK